ncbi:phytase [Halioxenophilus aromaticivorans]|uniref:Phytase n=1 Tax=Halioxenophilus aromaticivorans TaxID=1306992 RepID=A0AAV3U9G0_9ALTE
MVALFAFALVGCGATEAKFEQQDKVNVSTVTVQWQPKTDVATVAVLDRLALPHAPEHKLLAVEHSGLQIREGEKVVAQMAGNFENLAAVKLSSNASLVGALDDVSQQVTVLNIVDSDFDTTIMLPKQNYEVSNLCFYQDYEQNNYAFLISEIGVGSQWLLGRGERLLAEPMQVRSLPIPPNSQFCVVDQAHETLLVNEDGVGFWAYPAHAEADALRQPVALIKPFGTLLSAANMALVPNGVMLMDPEAQQLHIVQRSDNGWQPALHILLPEIDDPEQLHVLEYENTLQIELRDDDNDTWWHTAIDWPRRPDAPLTGLPVVSASVETQPVDSVGDAADDPAIWVHPERQSLSLVLATNKKAGLEVYRLDGSRKQSLPVGRLNNVDVRSGLYPDGQEWHLAGASHRDSNSISLFAISEKDGVVTHVSDIATALHNVYGFCLYRPKADELYAFINDKDGTVLQYEIDTREFTGSEVRRFSLGSQPEGCVADDINHRLFIGEEDVGVWVLNAQWDSLAEPKPVIKVGGLLHDDVEGIALYQRLQDADQAPLLVISSQGNDSYMVIDSEPPYKTLGAFRIGINLQQGIDGASETDGLAVTSADLGGGFSQGLLVVQDGRNRLPEQTQNFKFVPWDKIELLLGSKND